MQATTQTWCLTLPLIEERPFTVEERQALQRQLQVATAQAWVGFTLTPVALFGWMMAMLFTDDNLALMAVGFIGGPALIVASALIGYRSLLHARMAKGELRHGTVQRFEGEIDLLECETWLRKAKVPLTRKIECIEIYTQSGRVMRVNGSVYRGWDLVLPRSESARTPEIAHIAAQWLDPVGEMENGAPVLGGQRELSTEEIAELRKTALTSWWKGVRGMLLVSLWPGVMLISAITQGRPTIVYICWLLIIALLIIIHTIRILPFIRTLYGAAHIGIVLIVQVPDEPTETDSSQDESTIQSHVVFEMLPNSDYYWTINGTPAPWRRVGQ